MSDDTRDKVIKLEADVAHIKSAVDDMAKQVREMANLLERAKGAKWIIVGSAAIGGAVASKVTMLAGFFGYGK